MAERPLGMTVLAILGLLQAIGQLGVALWLVNLLPFVENGGERSTGRWIGAVLYMLIGALNLWIVHAFWMLRPGARKRAVQTSVINGILALLAVLTPATFWQSLPALAVNVAVFFYCRSAGVRRAFGEP